ncbi:TolC family protein [Sandaracinobacteroides saxicola]|uniref:Protein CyaE n=1 Tax=Sandaracinobacteroides saxicola TaxID=2759707 RepID=A0A7G5IIZ2_9SPHN|nr:TolC family protein [Sandaracinobacteroides saxicola]QMW23334.1 TolC family protein [Sandaracinobacteroides saxicola]
MRQRQVATGTWWLLLGIATAVHAGAALAGDDPRGLMPPSAPDYRLTGVSGPERCPTEVGAAPLTPVALVDLALCRNPNLRAAWAANRTAAAQAGQARASLLPTLSAALTPGASYSESFGSGTLPGSSTNATATASLSLNWLLFDFGGRRARIDAADAARGVALAGFADSAQGVVAQVVQGYNSVIAAEAADVAARESLRFASVSLEAARAREAAGVGLRSDTLQAQTAFSQAQQVQRQAEGQVAIARGQLAVSVALPPDAPLLLAPPPALETGRLMNERADALIREAERARPDLRRASANLAVAEANLRAARADRAPTVSLGVAPQVSLNDAQRNSAAGSVGVTLSIPLFTGWSRTYAVAAATSEVDRNAAQFEASRQAAGLDVWTALQTLRTQAATLDAARAAFDSAAAAAGLAQGRFRAGVASITELLNAQSSLANAQQALVAADFGVRSANVTLARAVGMVGEAVR